MASPPVLHEADRGPFSVRTGGFHSARESRRHAPGKQPGRHVMHEYTACAWSFALGTDNVYVGLEICDERAFVSL